jgi:hypothetical protein
MLTPSQKSHQVNTAKVNILNKNNINKGDNKSPNDYFKNADPSNLNILPKGTKPKPLR